MKSRDIKVGVTYCNRGKGKTWRKVQAISMACRPREFDGSITHQHEPGVRFVDNRGGLHRLYLSSFARWAGKEVG